jgi:hypothetical protein
MGFSRKRNVCSRESDPARRVAWEQQVHPAVMAEKAEKGRIQKEAGEAASAAARKAAEQDMKLATLEATVTAAAAREAAEYLKAQIAAAPALKEISALREQVAEMQALAAPSASMRPIYLCRVH